MLPPGMISGWLIWLGRPQDLLFHEKKIIHIFSQYFPSISQYFLVLSRVFPLYDSWLGYLGQPQDLLFHSTFFCRLFSLYFLGIFQYLPVFPGTFPVFSSYDSWLGYLAGPTARFIVPRGANFLLRLFSRPAP